MILAMLLGDIIGRIALIAVARMDSSLLCFEETKSLYPNAEDDNFTRCYGQREIYPFFLEIGKIFFISIPLLERGNMSRHMTRSPL